MSAADPKLHAEQVRSMFARIASRYDMLNRLMTFGRDHAWRREAIARLQLKGGGYVLDVGSGTGDLAFTCQQMHPETQVVACDFTPEMMALGKARDRAGVIIWALADATRLPFADQSFHGVVSGFLLRNVTGLDQALAEQVRVLKPGGRIVALDTTPPSPGPLAPLVHFHLRRVIPALGRLIAGNAAAYRYLPASTEAFADAETLAARLRTAGLEGVGFTRRMLGTIAIHWGLRPDARGGRDGPTG
ncbi:MAG: ubiquinone/menaquinone biosynthesis methyltransferase [Anaerolineales bacterium]